MCDPLTIAGAAAMVGSTLLNSFGEAEVASEREKAINAENSYQRAFSQEANQVAETERGRYDNFKDRQDAKTQSVADYYQQNRGAVPNEGPTTGAIPASQSNVVVQEQKKQGDKVNRFGQQQDQALASFRSFGDAFGGVGREVNRDRDQLGAINSFRRGSSAILPLELERASRAGGGYKTFADLLRMGGTVATTAGLGGKDIGSWFKPGVTGGYTGKVPYAGGDYAGVI